MITVLAVAAYIGIAALCVYLEGRLGGSADFAPMWIVWPFMLPIVLLAAAVEALARLGERHHG
jgi:hypothetical protein